MHRKMANGNDEIKRKLFENCEMHFLIFVVCASASLQELDPRALLLLVKRPLNFYNVIIIINKSAVLTH